VITASSPKKAILFRKWKNSGLYDEKAILKLKVANICYLQKHSLLYDPKKRLAVHNHYIT